MVFPATYVEEVFVVALGFAFLRLVFFAEVTAAAFVAVEGIVGDEFAHEDEVFEADSLFEFHVNAFGGAGNEEILVERLAQGFEFGKAFLQAFGGAAHAHVFPHDVAEFLVDRIHGTLALNGEELVDACLDSIFGSLELGQVGGEAGNGDLVAEVVLNGVGQHEVTVGQALHEGGCAEAVCTVVGEVALADGEEALHGSLQFIVYPDAAHRVVYGGVNHHRRFVGAFVGDFLIHVEEVAVACGDFVASEVLDGLREVEEHGKAGVVHAVALVAAFLSGAAGHVAGHEVTEGGIAALEVVVAVFFGNVLTLDFAALELLCVFEFLGHPDAAVVAERLRHKRELGLLVAVHGNAGGVDLNVRGVGEICALAVARHGSRAVAAHSVGGEEISVSVTAGADYYGVGRETFDVARYEVAGDDAAGAAVDDHDVEHLVARVQFNRAGVYLAHQGGVSAEKELLAGLAFGVESTAHLCAAEGAVGEHAAVFAGEGHALCHALVDDVGAHLGEAVNVGLAGAVVAALNGVVEEAINGVAVVLIVLGSVDTALCGDRVGAARRVLDAEVLHLETHFAERCGGACAGKARTYDDNVELTLVLGVNQFLMSLIVGPFFSHGTFGYS